MVKVHFAVTTWTTAEIKYHQNFTTTKTGRQKVVRNINPIPEML